MTIKNIWCIIFIISPYPGVPEQFSEDDQVGGMQRQAHVGGSDGQDSHAGLARMLKLVAQVLALNGRRGAIDTNEWNILLRMNVQE